MKNKLKRIKWLIGTLVIFLIGMVISVQSNMQLGYITAIVLVIWWIYCILARNKNKKEIAK